MFIYIGFLSFTSNKTKLKFICLYKLLFANEKYVIRHIDEKIVNSKYKGDGEMKRFLKPSKLHA